jgi:hypothetical protein
MFLNASELFWIATTYRAVNIAGRYGSGKTLLAVAMAFELWKRGYIDKIYSNFPMAGREIEYLPGDRDFVMILDEAHVVLDSRAFSAKASQTWLKDLRKRNSVLLVPAVMGVDVRFRAVMVQRFLMLGNFAWLYRWQIDDGMGVHGSWFALVRPSKYFGAYDTHYSPVDEDFENIQTVMSGEVRSNDRYDPTGGYTTVQERSFPVEEPKFKWQAPEISIKSIFGKGD